MPEFWQPSQINILLFDYVIFPAKTWIYGLVQNWLNQERKTFPIKNVLKEHEGVRQLRWKTVAFYCQFSPVEGAGTAYPYWKHSRLQAAQAETKIPKHSEQARGADSYLWRHVDKS